MHPALRSGAWPQGRDGSIAEIVEPLQGVALQPGDLVLLGLCNEAGVLANGGRAGAAPCSRT